MLIPPPAHHRGDSVTKEMSATTRMVLDSVRTMTIWGFSLAGAWLLEKYCLRPRPLTSPVSPVSGAVGWEVFKFMQIIGFVLLICGTFVYNDILIVPAMRKYGLLKPKELWELWEHLLFPFF
jgi:hypothetical protein